MATLKIFNIFFAFLVFFLAVSRMKCSDDDDAGYDDNVQQMSDSVKRSFANKMKELKSIFQNLQDIHHSIKERSLLTISSIRTFESNLYIKDDLQRYEVESKKNLNEPRFTLEPLSKSHKFKSVKNRMKVALVDIDLLDYRAKEAKVRLENLINMIHDPMVAYRNHELLKIAHAENQTSTFLEVKRFYEVRHSRYEDLLRLTREMIDKYQDVTVILTLAIDEIEDYKEATKDLGTFDNWLKDWNFVRSTLDDLHEDVLSNLYYASLKAEFRLSL